MHRYVIIVALAASLAACAVAGPPAGRWEAPKETVQRSPGVDNGAAQAPDTAPSAQVGTFNGTARYTGAPFADATVKAFLLGQNEVIATTSTDREGRFQLDLWAHAPQGALVKLVATRGNVTLASVEQVPMRPVLQAGDEHLPYRLNEFRTIAYMALGPRLDALGALTRSTDGVAGLQAASEAFRIFNAASAALLDAPPVPQAVFEDVTTRLFSPDGGWNDVISRAIGTLVPQEAAPTLAQLATDLGDLIRQEVALGKPVPNDTLVGTLTMGPLAPGVAPVFPEPVQVEEEPGPKEDPPPGGISNLAVEDGIVRDPEASPQFEVGR